MGRNELNQLLQEKRQAKKQVFAHCWPKVDSGNPLLIVFATEDKHVKELLFQLLEGLLVLPLQVVVVAKNQPTGSNASSLRGKITWIDPGAIKQPQLEKYLLAADMGLIFEEHQATIKKLFQHGIIPVGCEKSPLLANYHPNDETGNSFTFNTINPWDIFSAVVRAYETYRFPFDWQHLIRGILKVR